MSLVDEVRSHKHALKVIELAEILNVDERTVYKDVEQGNLPFFRIRTAIRFDPGQIVDYLATRMGAAGSPAMKKKKQRKPLQKAAVAKAEKRSGRSLRGSVVCRGRSTPN